MKVRSNRRISDFYGTDIVVNQNEEALIGAHANLNRMDPQAEVEPGAEMKKAVRSFSHLAVTCFCITIAVIAFLLIGQLIAGDPKALAAKGIVVLFVSAILLICLSYLAY